MATRPNELMVIIKLTPTCLKYYAAHSMADVIVVVGVYPTPSRYGGMAEDHGAPEAGKLPRIWTRGCKETESR